MPAEMETPPPQGRDGDKRSLVDIGGQLKHARERRGLSLTDAAAATKLSVDIVSAIERNDFDKLPAGMYRKAYLRTLAAEFGLDPARLVAEYGERFEAASAPPSLDVASGKPDQELLRQLAPSPRRSLLTLAGCVVAAAAWFMFYPRTTPANSHDNSFGETAAASAPLDEMAPDEVVQSGEIAAATAMMPIRIEMTTTGRCWVSAEADGARLIYRMVEPGESMVLEAEQTLSVRFGDAGAVMLSINGGSQHLAGPSGEVFDLKLTPEDIKHRRET